MLSSVPNRHRRVAAFFVAVALLASCAKRSAAVPDAAGTSLSVAVPGAAGSGRSDPALSAPGAVPTALVEISVIGTSDLHGRLGSLPLFAGYLRALRRARPGRVVLVDAGDAFQGTLESDLNEGAVLISAYRALGYHGLTIGNHEFDFGPVGPASTPRRPADDPRGALKRLARLARGSFPFLAANLEEGGKLIRWDNVRPSVLVTLPAGVRVGIIGVTTRAMKRVTHAANFRNMRAGSLAGAVVREARRLRRRGADMVVVAAHAGTRCSDLTDSDDTSSCHPRESLRLADKLPRGLVDVIVGAHTHGASAHRVNGIPVVQAYAKGKAFARVDLQWDPRGRRLVGSVIHQPSYVRRRATYEGSDVREDPAVAAIVARARRKAQKRRQEPLGVELTGKMRRSYSAESALGNFVTSLMLEKEPSAQVALYNGGGLRADLPAGPLLYGAWYDALPFGNRMVVVTLTGAQLGRILRRNLRSRGGFLSIAGASVRSRCRRGRARVDVRLRGGGRLRASDRVQVVTSDFLASSRGFPHEAPRVSRPGTLRDSLAALLKKRGGRVKPHSWYRRSQRRVRYPGRRPVRCW